MTVYRIKDWDSHFEKNRTKELKFMTWVPFPNKHDGDGYTELVDHPDGAAHFGCWCAIVQVASKCDPRGTLLRDGRRPHTADSLARMTRLSEQFMSAAIERLIAIGWVDVIEYDEPTYDTSQDGAIGPQDDASSRACAIHGTEQNNTERKDTEQHGPQATASMVRAVFDHYRTYHPRSFPKPSAESKEWKKIRDRFSEGYTVDDLKSAIDGNHNSPWHRGENDQRKAYHALELIVRDGSHVQQFMEIQTGGNVALMGKNQRTVRSGVSFLQKRMGDNEQNGITETG